MAEPLVVVQERVAEALPLAAEPEAMVAYWVAREARSPAEVVPAPELAEPVEEAQEARS